MLPKYTIHQPKSTAVTAYDLVQAQEATRRVLDEVTRRPHLGGNVLAVEISLVAGSENLVEHGLGKAVRGWRLADIQGPAMVWRVVAPTTNGYDSAKHLALACTSDVTVLLEVYD